MQIATIDRYLREIARQLRFVRPKHDAANWKICTDAIIRSDLRRLRTKLVRQRLYRSGHEDRIVGRGPSNANGAYLDGYYSGDGRMYYVTWSDLDSVVFGRVNLYSR